ncbi:MAG TPA: SBBP repeat-containing protein [Thermoanaerobaculia bacterium]|nr:SBBP repeat-containing protein [Thermoanaerobaculia bacterium]
MRIGFSGARRPSSITGEDPLPGRANYFIGKDPSKWRTDVPMFRRVVAHDVYAGIDLVYHGAGNDLEYDFVVHPGADANQIRVSFAGASRIDQEAGGDIVLHVADGTIRQHVPTVYQEDGGRRTLLQARYRRTSASTFSFDVARFDRTKDLVIDPTLAWSAYLGGGDSFDLLYGIAVDAAGNTYVAGYTGSTAFPTVAPYQSALRGTKDVVVAKLDPTASSIVYATYLGGASDDVAYGIAVNGAGEAFVTGQATSTDFPTTAGALQSVGGAGWPAGFVTRLNSTGNALVYSATIGRSYENVTTFTGIALDAESNAHVTGETTGAYPTTAGAIPGATFFSHDYRAVFSVLNASGTSLLYSTCLAGSGGSYASGIAVDPSGSTYLTGTSSRDFPTTPGSFQTPLTGDPGSWVAKFSATNTLVYSTFLGDPGDQTYAVAADSSGNAYVTGVAGWGHLPVTAGAVQTSPKGGGDAFVTKLNATGTALLYSTYLGGSQSDTALGISVDSAGNAYVCGSTSSPDFPTANPIQTDKGPFGFNQSDAFVTKIDPAGRSLPFSTYLGGNESDTAYAIHVNGAGDDVRVVGSTASSDFPTNRTLGTRGPWAAGNFDGFITSIVIREPDLAIAMNHSGDIVEATSRFNYTIHITNAGTTPTSGTVAVTDTLPAGMTATAMSGANWTCNVGALTCTTAIPIAAGSAYPDITLTVNVSASLVGTVSNTATVSGGGETNLANNTTSDATIIVPMPRKRSVRHS